MPEPESPEPTRLDLSGNVEQPERELTRDERRSEKRRLKSVRSERRKQNAQRKKHGKNQSKGKGEGGKGAKKRR